MPDKKPLCPYCGPWNGHPDGVEMNAVGRWKAGPKATFDESDMKRLYRYKCPVCGALTPDMDTLEDATNTANRRFQPMQKPLELKEFLQDIIAPFPVWVEMADGGSLEPAIAMYYDPSGFVKMDGYRGDVLCGIVDGYGTKWRVWHTLNRPTFEERAAAKWEENHEASTP